MFLFLLSFPFTINTDKFSFSPTIDGNEFLFCFSFERGNNKSKFSDGSNFLCSTFMQVLFIIQFIVPRIRNRQTKNIVSAAKHLWISLPPPLSQTWERAATSDKRNRHRSFKVFKFGFDTKSFLPSESFLALENSGRFVISLSFVNEDSDVRWMHDEKFDTFKAFLSDRVQ